MRDVGVREDVVWHKDSEMRSESGLSHVLKVLKARFSTFTGRKPFPIAAYIICAYNLERISKNHYFQDSKTGILFLTFLFLFLP